MLLAQHRACQPGGVLVWLAMPGEVLVSLAANAAAAQPTLLGRATALVPPLALAVTFELVRSLIAADSRPSPADAPDTRRDGGEADQPAPTTLEKRAAELVTASSRNGQPVGRGRLARELEITEHQARQLLERVATNRTT